MVALLLLLAAPLARAQFTYSEDFNTNPQTAWLDYGTNRHEVTPAPEPATYGALMIGGALGLIGYRRWRRNNKPVSDV